MSPPPLSGVYLLLDEQWADKMDLCRVLELAVDCGIGVFQYRNTTGAMREAFDVAKPLREIAARRGVVFIVNDRCDLALAVEADGVHLGQHDLPPAMARDILGRDKIIGVSTHCRRDVETATREGADYLGYGPIAPSTTKPDHEPPVGLDGLRDIRPLTPLPVFAIGGVTPDMIQDIITAGADGIAVASAVLDASPMNLAMLDLVSHFPAQPSPPPASPRRR